MSAATPVAVIPSGAMSKPDIGRLRKVGVCAVEAAEPIDWPHAAEMNISERAAVAVIAQIFASAGTAHWYPADVRAMFAREVVRRIPLRGDQ